MRKIQCKQTNENGFIEGSHAPFVYNFKAMYPLWYVAALQLKGVYGYASFNIAPPT